MAISNTTHVLKKSVVPSQTLPSSGILQGEPLVNLGDGILFFTGGTAGSPTWVDSGNATAGYFEVGSNLYQLKIRDKIKESVELVLAFTLAGGGRLAGSR